MSVRHWIPALRHIRNTKMQNIREHQEAKAVELCQRYARFGLQWAELMVMNRLLRHFARLYGTTTNELLEHYASA